MLIMMPFILALVIGLLVMFIYIKELSQYKRSGYKSASGNTLSKTMFDKGCRGEFLTYRYLEKVSGYSKILANAYIPKEDGKTTEIDLIFVHQKGIYVIESKNYSEWIVGDENSKSWMQTFPNGYKQRFYNPIWQNNTHIKHLNNSLNDLDKEYFKSIIVFSERCSIKKMNVVSKNVKVLKRENLYSTLNSMINTSTVNLSIQEIDNIYSRLTPYILKTEEEKREHIQNIKIKSK